MSSKFILQQEDGTVANGNARGEYAVDLQMVRSSADQVASSNNVAILSGENNKINTSGVANGNVIVGGRTNNIRGNNKSGCFIGSGNENQMDGATSIIVGGVNNVTYANETFIGGGRSNTNNSTNGTISGGQTNTTSTNTHATVVGGSSNTASGQYSVAGGQSNVASGFASVALGNQNTASGGFSVALGSRSQATNLNSIAIGGWSASGGPLASGQFSVALGFGAQSVGDYCFAVGSGAYASGSNAVAFQGARAEQNHSIAFGQFTKGYFEYGFSLANGRFASNGDAQISFFPRKTEATLTSGGTTTLNGGTPEGFNRAWNVTVKWVAFITADGGATGITVGDSIASTEQLLFKRVGGVSSLVGSASTLSTHSDASMASCSMTYTAGASQELALTFTGPTFASGGPVTCRVVAKIELTEVGA